MAQHGSGCPWTQTLLTQNGDASQDGGPLITLTRVDVFVSQIAPQWACQTHYYLASQTVDSLRMGLYERGRDTGAYAQSVPSQP